MTRAGLQPLFFCLIALACFWAVVSLTYPFGWDQGIFAWVGEGITTGEMPYRDRWDIKGPFTFSIYTLAQTVFGHNLWGIRLIDLVLVLSAAFMLKTLVSHFTDKVVARLSAVLFVLWYASLSFWHTAQPDGWASMLLLFAFGLLVLGQSDVHWSRLLVIGILIGCCTLIKPIYFIFIVVVFVSMFLQARMGISRALFNCGVVTTGLIVPLALCLGWFAYQGALQSLFDIWIVYPLNVYSGITDITPLSRVRGFIEYLLSGEVISVMLPVMGVGIFSLWRSNKTSAIVMILWLTFAAFCVILQGRFFKYHWVVIYPPVAFFCAAGFHALFFRSNANVSDENVRPNQILQVAASILLLVVVFHVTVRPAFEVANGLLFIVNGISNEQYYAGYGVPGPDLQAAKYIQSKTEKNDRVFIWGWNISILYLSERQTVSRFGYSMPLLMGEGTKEREAYRQEFLNNLYADPPVYIVVAKQSDVILGRHYDLSSFGELAEFVSSRYVEEKTFGDLALYRIVVR